MIAKLKGIIDSILTDESSVIVDVSGVGYFVIVSSQFISTVNVGESVDLNIYHIIKAETQYLCGFQRPEEMRAFKILLDVHGVGVKSAMSVLSALSLEELALAIATQNADMLVNAEGIGKKTAARILLELKDKTIVKLDAGAGNRAGNMNDAILGLISLGYQKNTVMKVINKVLSEIGSEASTNEFIVACLQSLNNSPA